MGVILIKRGKVETIPKSKFARLVRLKWRDNRILEIILTGRDYCSDTIFREDEGRNGRESLTLLTLGEG